MKNYIVYTDGSSVPNPGFGGWSAIVLELAKGKVVDEIILSGGHISTTNNQMELEAVIGALEYFVEPSNIVINSDSQYVILGIVERFPLWLKNGFRTRTGTPVKNDVQWKKLYKLSLKHQISWNWVRSHNGNQYNEKADQMADEARLNIIREFNKW